MPVDAANNAALVGIALALMHQPSRPATYAGRGKNAGLSAAR
jgi:hypothetical protein